MKRILVLCTGNSCRSQILHGFLEHILGNKALVYSAGIEAHGLNPRAVETMKEVNIDISDHTSNKIKEYKDIEFDYVISVCDNARENCPYFPAKTLVIHKDFADPAKLHGSENEIKQGFRRVRDELEIFAREFAGKYFE